MRSPKIPSIYFHAVSLVVLCSIPSSFSLFRLQDLDIKHYYLGYSKIYSTENNSRLKRRGIGSNDLVFPLQLNHDHKPVEVLIKKRQSDVVLENTRILHIFTGQNVKDNTTESYMEDSHLYEGYILENPHNSSINGYIKDNCFYGHVIINYTFYYVDEFNRLKDNASEDVQRERNAVIYTRDSVIFTDFRDLVPDEGNVLTSLSQIQFRSRFQSWKKKGMLCPMVVVIDHSFLNLIHRGNIDAAKFQVLFSLEEVNAIYRSTDFDGDGIPDNIGFYVKKIVVLSTEESLYFITKYTSDFIDVNEFIQKFRRYKELQNHCLGMVFTAQKFQLKTLGASFSADNKKFSAVGGICEAYVPEKGSYNTLVVTVVTENYNPVPQMIFEVTIAHELGHSYGSSHDDVMSPKCFGHLMSPTTFHDYDKNKYRMQFSLCSKQSIIRTLVWKGECFEPVRTSFCGNGLVEDDEQCDCGLTRDCLDKDPCCIPRRTKQRPCRVNKNMGFECHPSQGECCTNQCKYSSHLEKYVNCRHFEQTCPCPNSQTKCSCGINGMCLHNECHSVECTRLGLSECQCQQEELTQTCSVCCQYGSQCLPVLEATSKVINDEARREVVASLLSTEESSKQGKNWASKRFCGSNGSSTKCANLHFFQGKMDDYCLHKGKLGKCSRSYDCKILPSKQVFPSLESSGRKSFCKFSVVTVVFYFVCFGFKNIFT